MKTKLEKELIAKELLAALKAAVSQLEAWISSELGGTKYYRSKMSDLEIFKALIKKVEREK